MPIAPDQIAAVARILADHAGLQLPTWVVEARTAARMARLGADADEYVALIDSGRGAGELAQLIEAVRVGETRLFRHRPQIDALAAAVVPALRGKPSVRVWSAGCSAGEEVYTLASVLSRALPAAELAVVGTDVSAEAIAAARAGRYAADAIARVPEPWRDDFEVAGDGRTEPRAKLREVVSFERANLLEAPPGDGFDLVWCRNVLIYFTAAARAKAIARLVGATAVGGFVFVGYSESLRDVLELEPLRSGDAQYYQRRSSPRTSSPQIALRAATGSQPAIAPPPVARPSQPRLARISSPGIGIGVGVGAGERERIALRGHPDPEGVATALGGMLASHRLRTLAIELDGADLLADELAPVLRRGCAALRAAGVEVELCATRPGARRWLARHGLLARADTGEESLP